MAKLLRFGILASLAAYASAKCDNQCSGHGTCMTDDVCQCYDNFGSGLSHDSGDCSDRICPFEVAWVDHPDVAGHHHKYMECAGKGICDRSTGECSCFEGYEGKGCQRSACPNDCSDHGRCDYIEDLPYGATWNDWVDENSVTSEMTSRTQSLFSDDAKMFEYHLWDKSKSRKCVCDATYGDLDCSKRLCPYGTDVLDTKDDTYYGLDEQKYQEQTILLSSLSGDFDQLASKSFALTFTSRLNETFTTVPIALSGSTDVIDLQNDIKLALLKLPNGVIDGVKVAVDYIEAAELYKLVSDNLFPSITFTATTVAGTGTTGADSMTTIATVTNAQTGKLAVGCSLSGDMVPRVSPTTVTAFGNIGTTAQGTMLKSDGTALAYSGGPISVADTETVTACTVGSASITMTDTPTVSVGDWVSIPACGISAAQVKTVAAPLVLEAGGEATIAVATATAALYKLSFTCTLNGQLIARFGMSLGDGGSGAHGTINEFIVGYGGLVPGCTVANVDTGNTDIDTGSTLATFTVTHSWTSQQMFSVGTDKDFTCAQYYLPGTHQFTTPNGIARGQVYDYSGNYIGGQDAAVLPKIASSASDPVNHRRRLSSHSPLLSIKIGFSGPSVQGPQHLLIVEEYKCDAGCTPKLTGMPLETRQTSSYWSTIVELTKSDFNSYECGRRGKCDYATGLCQCFAGYVGDNCNTLTTLV
jgi:hypothetical protein